jgi:branched-chain amino acid transport system permease protein
MKTSRFALAWVLVGLAALVLVPVVFDSPYHLQILTQLLIWAVLFIGLDIAVGHAGLVSVAHGALFGLGAYVTGILTVDMGWGFWSTLPAPGLFGSIEIDRSQGMYYLMLAVCALCVVGSYLLMRTSTGQRLRAIRDNGALAAAIGIDVSRTRLIAFIISAGVAALSGSFQASNLAYINPSVASYEIGFTALMAIIVGGRTLMAGPFLGAAIFVILPELLRDADQYRLIVLGSILILVVQFAPDGLAGRIGAAAAAVRRWREKRQRNNNGMVSVVEPERMNSP